MPSNPPWTKEELILALHLYMEIEYWKCRKKTPEVKKLSLLLNKLPIHPQYTRQSNFRTEDGVFLKLQDISRNDSRVSGKWDYGSKLDKVVWDERPAGWDSGGGLDKNGPNILGENNSLRRRDDIRTFCREHCREMEMIRGWLGELEAA